MIMMFTIIMIVTIMIIIIVTIMIIIIVKIMIIIIVNIMIIIIVIIMIVNIIIVIDFSIIIVIIIILGTPDIDSYPQLDDMPFWRSNYPQWDAKPVQNYLLCLGIILLCGILYLIIHSFFERHYSTINHQYSSDN